MYKSTKLVNFVGKMRARITNMNNYLKAQVQASLWMTQLLNTSGKESVFVIDCKGGQTPNSSDAITMLMNNVV